jgi:hypothetical protein
MTFTPSVYLRRVLLLDAVATFATGVLLLGGMSLLQSLLNLPISLMTYAGVFCVAWAALVGFAFTRRQLTRGFVWTIVIGNALGARLARAPGLGLCRADRARPCFRDRAGRCRRRLCGAAIYRADAIGRTARACLIEQQYPLPLWERVADNERSELIAG